MRTLLNAIFWPAIIFLHTESAFGWSAYFELGTSLGKLTSVDRFLGQSTAISSNLGFCGSFSAYLPVTSPQNIFHFELGLQNRMYFVSSSEPQMDIAALSVNLAARVQFYRFFVGAGYAPITLASTSGPFGLHSNPNVTSYFLEGGAIWRVVPELQIVAVYAVEYGTIPGGGSKSPSPGTEYGLRFRFPFAPYDSVGDASSKFDGFRYPFGIMK